MPELPEVETVCRGLRPHIVNQTIIAIHNSGYHLRRGIPHAELARDLIGTTIVRVDRRAKYILISMASGHILVIHLGMTGKLGIYAPSLPPAKHCHLRFVFSNGQEMRYIDSRRFGSVQLCPPAKAAEIEQHFFASTGPEPFSSLCSSAYLQQTAQGRTVAIKLFIMTNAVMAGVGNIYANESLFQAGIRPDKAAGQLSSQEWQDLIDHIRAVLNEAIACGGSTISDYVNADQQRGYFQINFRVYGRKGENCQTCGTLIEKMVLGGRATYFCPKCQQ